MRNSIFLIIFFIIVILNLSSQPVLKWSFDLKDSSFGQTASNDIDGDGYYELVFGCYKNDSCIYALNSEDGTLLWKYNTSDIGITGCNDVAPLLYDITGDGIKEVFVPSSCNPYTYCFDGKTGNLIWKTKTRGSDSPPTIADLDNDGKLEIIHGEFGGYVTAIDAETGAIKWDFLVDTNCSIQTAPTICDVDLDNQLDFILATWKFGDQEQNYIKVYDGKSLELKWKYPLKDISYHGTAISDLDNDNKPELIIGDYAGEINVLNGENGSLLWTYQFSESHYVASPISIGDLDGDGECELVFGSSNVIICLNANGEVRWNYTMPSYAYCFRGVVLTDLNNNSSLDVVFGTNFGQMIALNGLNGQVLWNIDFNTMDGKPYNLDHAPIIADFEKDGLMDLFIIGGYNFEDIRKNYGKAFCFSLGETKGPEWLMFQNNELRTSSICNIPTEIDQPYLEKVEPICFNNFSIDAENIMSFELINNKSINLNIELYNLLGQKIASLNNGFFYPNKNDVRLPLTKYLKINELNNVLLVRFLNNSELITTKKIVIY